MKKIVLLSLIIQCAVISSAFSNEPPLVKELKTGAYQTLVINANVTVVLTNEDEQALRMSGDETFMSRLTIKQIGHRLYIGATKNADLLSKGIIYIPAAKLQQIQVNSAAHVKSSGPLQIPNLQIRINGECKIHIVHVGELNLTGNDYYDYTQESKEMLIPSAMLRKQ